MGYDNDARRNDAAYVVSLLEKLARLRVRCAALFLFFAIASAMAKKRVARSDPRAPKRPPLVNYIIRNREFCGRGALVATLFFPSPFDVSLSLSTRNVPRTKGL